MSRISQPPVDDYIRESLLTAQGDIVQRGAAGSERVAIGFAMDFLRVNAAGNGVEWRGMQKAQMHLLGAGQSIPSGSATVVTLDTDGFDPANISDLANYRFKPTLAGYYIVEGRVLWGAYYTGVEENTYLCKNGVAFANFRHNTSVNGAYSHTHTVYGIIYLNGSTDYVDLEVSHDRGSNVNIVGGTYQHTQLNILGPF
jgi:hypothetical protein